MAAEHVWTARRDGDQYAGELTLHPHGVEGRVTRNGALVVSIVWPTREEAEAYLDRQRRVLVGELMLWTDEGGQTH